MTIIAIQCPACRTTDDVYAPALFVDVDAATGDEGSAATVTWVCSACDELVSIPVQWAPLLTVVSAGGALVEASDITDSPDSTEDARPAHPERPGDGALLTPDDLLDFHEGLDSANWLDELCASAEHKLGAGPA